MCYGLPAVSVNTIPVSSSHSWKNFLYRLQQERVLLLAEELLKLRRLIEKIDAAGPAAPFFKGSRESLVSVFELFSECLDRELRLMNSFK